MINREQLDVIDTIVENLDVNVSKICKSGEVKKTTFYTWLRKKSFLEELNSRMLEHINGLTIDQINEEYKRSSDFRFRFFYAALKERKDIKFHHGFVSN